MHVKSRPAAVGDRLVTTNFNTGTRGFAAAGDPSTAVCVMPGTELAFAAEVTAHNNSFLGFSHRKSEHSTAIFRQHNKHIERVHHDYLEFPDGKLMALTELVEGQHAIVLQLPAAPKTKAEAEEQRRAEVVG